MRVEPRRAESARRRMHVHNHDRPSGGAGMSTNNVITILLVEDEDFDVRRVKNTIRLFAERLQIADVVSNGRAALDLIQKNQTNTTSSSSTIIFPGAAGRGTHPQDQGGGPVHPDHRHHEDDHQCLGLRVRQQPAEVRRILVLHQVSRNIEEYIYQPTDFILSIFNAYEKDTGEAQAQGGQTPDAERREPARSEEADR